MKYKVEITGSIVVDADSEDDAKMIAQEKPHEKWSWDFLDAEEDI